MPNPHGNDASLAEAVEILAAYARDALGEDLAPAELSRFRARIETIGEDFREGELARVNSRPKHVLEQMKAIEKAARALAKALSTASPTTYLAIGGYLSSRARPLAQEREPSEEEKRRRDLEVARHASLLAIVSRYAIPFAPHDPDDDLREITAGMMLSQTSAPHDPKGDSRKIIAIPAALQAAFDGSTRYDWSVGALALAELIGMLAMRFEPNALRRLARQREVIDAGPAGKLPHDPPRDRSPNRRRRNRNTVSDAGGTLNLLDEAHGPPKWCLARECWGILADIMNPAYRPITGQWNSPLAALVRAVYQYASGLDPEAPGAGLEHQVRNAAKIMGRRNDLVFPRFGFGPELSDEDVQRRISLDRASFTGRIPAWMGREGKQGC